ncbi:hypothetical protein [Mucilaginibacter ginsenosidivorans]|uniref:Uncharacterized protein n=1 Tax=Mucilaginibacter ginsenosidivorans TaxID=398053 RepID=A0A5B8UXH5_9SPHI|nr:hypothetical protein [Mucilaginibacter ginsenosidivorans]QEC63041.1 hypothetical protein FRZ54_10770 [Mucilaginibacter ginsenosidivorans]
MKRLPNLKKKAAGLREDIRKILLDNYRFDESLSNRLNQVAHVTRLREELSLIEREIRELEVGEYPGHDRQAMAGVRISADPAWQPFGGEPAKLSNQFKTTGK